MGLLIGYLYLNLTRNSEEGRNSTFGLIPEVVKPRTKLAGQRYINITRNAIGPKSGQKDCRKF